MDTLKRIVCVFTAAILVCFTGIAADAYADENEYYSAASEILSYGAKRVGAVGIQEMIDGYITENSGVSEADWYALCLARYGNYDLSAYLKSAEGKMHSGKLNAAERLRIAMAYYYSGGSGEAVASVIDECSGGLGIMSEIYSLILINSGKLGCRKDAADIARSLINRQFSDGGWALSGKYSNADVTAMALQALSAYKGNADFDVRIEKALARLSDMQQSSGGWSSYGTLTSESCSQVIIALCQLGINPDSDSRFIKNGNTAMDALMKYKCADGGFSHISGGASNGMATVQAAEAYIALSRFSSGGLYNLIPQKAELDIIEPTTSASGNNSVQKPENTQTSTQPVHVQTTSSAKSSSKVTSVQTAYTDTITSETKNTDRRPGTETSVTGQAEKSTETFTETSAMSDVSETEKQTHTEASSDPDGLSVAMTGSAADTTAGGKENHGLSAVENESDDFPLWKLIMLSADGGVLIISAAYLAARRQLTLRRGIFTAAACTAAAGVILLVRIQTPEEYYARNIEDIRSDSLTVSMSVHCGAIADEADISPDIIPETKYVLLDGDTAFTLLERVLAYNRIPFDYSGVSSTDVYVRGIDGIYEMDYGEMSGWMYTVNGEFPDSGCGSCYLSDGDKVEWIYTREIGRDIGAEEYIE